MTLDATRVFIANHLVDARKDDDEFTADDIGNYLGGATTSVSINISAALSAANAGGAGGVSTADSKGVSAGTAASVADSKAVSDSLLTSTALSTATTESKAVSVSANASVADSKGVSSGTAASVADSKSLSVSTLTSTADSKAVSCAQLPRSRSITLETPTNAEKIALFFTTNGITISKLAAVLPGGSATPSVTYSIRYGTDISGVGTEVVTGGSTVTSITTETTVTSFNSATIPAGSTVWLTTTAQSGTVPQLHVSVEFQ